VIEAVMADPRVDILCISALHEPNVLNAAFVLGEAAANTEKPVLFSGVGAAAAFGQVLAAMRAKGIRGYGSPDAW
jgi:hypothetical protein